MSDSKSRIYGGHPEISSSDVHTFYCQRLLQHTPLGAVILNHKSGIPEKRDLSERQKLTALLGDIPAQTRVLDLGCGTGRLASFFVNRVEKYVGIDFTAAFIDHAKNQYVANPEFEFHVANIAELGRFADLYARSFNLIIATGILMYLNDDIVTSTLQQVANLLLPQAQVYAREVVTVIDQRITLQHHYSKELEASYDAIYRTPAEYRALLSEGLVNTNLKIHAEGYLLNQELGARQETNQHYFYLSSK